jgi:predicted MFS family arabinose efflux permease
MEVSVKDPAAIFRFSKKEKYLVTALAFLQFTHIVDFMLLMPLGPVLIAQFGITNTEFSYLVSSYTFSAGLSALFVSTFIDRYNRKKVLLVVFAGFSFSTLLCGLSHTYQLLLLSRIITGAFGGLINSMVYSIIGDSFAYEHRGRATGVVMAAFSAASVAGIPISLVFANRFGWNAPFLGLFAVGFIFLFFAYYAIPYSEKVSRSHSYFEIFTTPSHYASFFLTLSLMLGGFSMIPYISNFLVFDTIMTESDLPVMYLYGGLATYITSRLIGNMSDRFGKKLMFYIIAGLSIVPVFMISRLNERYSMTHILIVTTVFFIFISGRWVPSMALITSVVKPQIRGSFMAFNTAIQQLGSGAATFIGGIMIAQAPDNVLVGYDHVSYFSIASIIVSVICVYFIRIYDAKSVKTS